MDYKNFEEFCKNRKCQIKEMSDSVKEMDYPLFIIHIINFLLVLTFLTFFGKILFQLLSHIQTFTFLTWIKNEFGFIADIGLAKVFLSAVGYPFKLSGVSFSKIFSFKDMFVFDRNTSLIIFLILFFSGVLVLLVKHLFDIIINNNPYGRQCRTK